MQVYRFLNYRTILVNLLFVGYLLFLQPTILQRLEATKGFQGADPLIGGLLLALPIFELGGVYLKHPVSAYYFHHYPAKRFFQDPNGGAVGVGCFLIAVILHLGMSVSLTLMAFQVLGVRTSGGAPLFPQVVLLVVIFAVMAKEVAFLVLWYNPFGGSTLPPKNLTSGLILRDIMGDLLLLAFAAVGYTALWDAMLSPISVHGGGQVVAWGYFGALVHFLFIYPLLQSIYLFQMIFLEKDRVAETWAWLSFAFVLFAALFSIPRV